MKTKLNKEIVQQLFNEAEGTFIKELNRSLKSNNFVEACYDSTVGLCIMFTDLEGGTSVWSDKYQHYIAKVGTNCRPMSVKQDTFELETSHVIIPCAELSAPEYKPITVKDILSIPRTDGSLEVTSLLEEITGKDSTDFVEDYYKLPCPDVTIAQLMSYSQGYDGKYGQDLHVLSFKGEDVALVSSHGKWTDTYTVTAISENYSFMVKCLEDTYIAEYSRIDILTLEDEYEMIDTLEDMFARKEYIVQEGEQL